MSPRPVALLVEDNLLVLDLLAEIVTELGYRAVETTDGDAALAAMQDNNFALLISDQRLPGDYSGSDLATHFRRLSPNAPILLTSGAPIIGELPASNVMFLQKPFTVAMLRTALAGERVAA